MIIQYTVTPLPYATYTIFNMVAANLVNFLKTICWGFYWIMITLHFQNGGSGYIGRGIPSRTRFADPVQDTCCGSCPGHVLRILSRTLLRILSRTRVADTVQNTCCGSCPEHVLWILSRTRVADPVQNTCCGSCQEHMLWILSRASVADSV
jgi:bacterioferritin-associated ferredoxin